MAEEKKTVAAPKAEKKAPAKKAAPKKEAAPKEAVKEEKAPAKKAAPKAKKAPKEEVKAEKKAPKAKKAEPVAEKAAVKEAHAFARDVRVTPRKVRLVINLVRGKDVDEAVALLNNLNKAASVPVRKLIQSAAANATNNFHLDGSKLYVSMIQASDGIKMKRYLPRGKGSSSGLVKRSSNIRVTVKERE